MAFFLPSGWIHRRAKGRPHLWRGEIRTRTETNDTENGPVQRRPVCAGRRRQRQSDCSTTQCQQIVVPTNISGRYPCAGNCGTNGRTDRRSDQKAAGFGSRRGDEKVGNFTLVGQPFRQRIFDAQFNRRRRRIRKRQQNRTIRIEIGQKEQQGEEQDAQPSFQRRHQRHHEVGSIRLGSLRSHGQRTHDDEFTNLFVYRRIAEQFQSFDATNTTTDATTTNPEWTTVTQLQQQTVLAWLSTIESFE